jgi:hypothetical protein
MQQITHLFLQFIAENPDLPTSRFEGLYNHANPRNGQPHLEDKARVWARCQLCRMRLQGLVESVPAERPAEYQRRVGPYRVWRLTEVGRRTLESV